MEFQLQPQSFQGMSYFKQRIYTIFKIFIKNGEKSVSTSVISVKRCFPGFFLYLFVMKQPDQHSSHVDDKAETALGWGL